MSRSADPPGMRGRAIAAFAGSSGWVVTGALALALLSIGVITTLQARASESHEAQVTLTQIARDFGRLQSIPYDGIGGDAAAQAAVEARMHATQRRIALRLAELRRQSPTRYLAGAVAPYRGNKQALERIHGFVIRGDQAGYDRLGPVAGRFQDAVVHQLELAGAEYQRRAARSQRLATLGSAVTILVLVSLFGIFYLRSGRAHARAESLARENARLLVQDSQLLVVQRLALAGEYRDDDTGEHTWRVAQLARRIGAALGMAPGDLDLLEQAAQLHDVGKIGVPDRILLKPRRLTPDEFEEMKAHTTLGAAMLSRPGMPLLEMAEEIALTHHERWDGSGYPAGLAGEAIPLVGRIVSVADVFDALTHARPYKGAWPIQDATAEIQAQRRRQFDPEIVDAFLSVIAETPTAEAEEAAILSYARGRALTLAH